jgi:hypothetical protein
MVAELVASAAPGKGTTVECCICSDQFCFDFIVPCLGDPTMHFFCKTCFHSNATITNTRPIASIICPVRCARLIIAHTIFCFFCLSLLAKAFGFFSHFLTSIFFFFSLSLSRSLTLSLTLFPCGQVPKCGSLFATQDARRGVSRWEALQLQIKQDDIDSRVALAGVAQLHCPCGTVAVVRKEDVGNGIVLCMCGKCYCVKCGNFSHGNTPCPPPADTLKWLQKHAKPCPNCHNQIQKNGGCDHMTCSQTAGGCGYEFWFSCGCDFKKPHMCARGGGISLPAGMYLGR